MGEGADQRRLDEVLEGLRNLIDEREGHTAYREELRQKALEIDAALLRHAQALEDVRSRMRELMKEF